MKIKPFHGSLLQSSIVDNVPQFFNELRNSFSTEFEENHYVKCEKPCYFIYQILKNGLSHHGLVVQNSPEDVINHKIFKHELILPNKFDKVKGLIMSTGYMIKPIMMFHKRVDELNDLLNEQLVILPLAISVKLEDEIHNIYALSDDKVVDKITKIFAKKIPEAFIADGHHRYETISQLIEKEAAMNPSKAINLLSAYFSSDMLNIVPINRLVKLPSDTGLRVVKAMFKSFGKLKKVKELSPPDKKYNFVVAFGNKQYQVKFKKSIVSKYKANTELSLTVQILENELSKSFIELNGGKLEMEYIIGKPDKKTRGEIKGELKMIILLPPIKLKDIMKVSRQGRTLPAKSTWFTPKVRSGLVIGKI